MNIKNEYDNKSMTIRELRARLKARQTCQFVDAFNAPVLLRVAGANAEAASSCVVALPRQRNNATRLIREFMEVDGVNETEAEALAAVSITPRPPAEWLAMLTELDTLIDRYCKAANVSQAGKETILKARAGQALITVPATLAWFRWQVGTLEVR